MNNKNNKLKEEIEELKNKKKDNKMKKTKHKYSKISIEDIDLSLKINGKIIKPLIVVYNKGKEKK